MRKIKVVVLLVRQLQHGFTKNAKVSPNLTIAHNFLYEQAKIQKKWRDSLIIRIYKEKGDTQDCGNYGGIKLMSNIMCNEDLGKDH